MVQKYCTSSEGRAGKEIPHAVGEKEGLAGRDFLDRADVEGKRTETSMCTLCLPVSSANPRCSFILNQKTLALHAAGSLKPT